MIARAPFPHRGVHIPHPLPTTLLQVKPALDAIRALGPVLEDHLQLLLPALNRLIVPGGSGLPLAVQVRRLRCSFELACGMQLQGRPLHQVTRSCFKPAFMPLARVQEETLAAMQDLLPRMQLAGFSSTVLHPLIRLLDG